jgi:antirestriction protein ArdC
MSERISVYEQVTDRIVAFIESKKELPWRMPWAVIDSELAPSNYLSKKPYKGINMLLTGMRGYTCPYWVTYRQAINLKGRVKKDEKGTPVVYWSTFEKSTEDIDETKETSSRRIGFYKAYTVFNLEQCEGIEWTNPIPLKDKEFNPIELAEKTIGKMPKRPHIRYGGIVSAYSPIEDAIRMPLKQTFISEELYYSTLLHELAHSTGHDCRLGRFKAENEDFHFGSASYSKEELVAEMTASFVMNELEIENQLSNSNSEAYIANWLKVLKGNSKLVIHAASKAVPAANFIMGRL